MTCDAGFYVDTNKCSTCAPCLQGTYSAGGSVLSCTNCPTGKTVSEGEGKSETDCTWGEIQGKLTTKKLIIYQIPVITIRQAQVPITETNSSSKTVKLLSEECNGGHYMDISTGCHICGKGTYSPGGATVFESQCKICPTFYTTTGLAVKVEDCVFLPGMKLRAHEYDRV